MFDNVYLTMTCDAEKGLTRSNLQQSNVIQTCYSQNIGLGPTMYPYNREQ